MGAKISNSSPVFIRSEPNFMINKAVMREYKFMVYIGDLPKLKKLMGKWEYPKMCNIFKMADRRA